MNKRNLYSVPDLPLKDIVGYLSDINIPINSAEILKPTQASVQRLYDSILDLFVGPSKPVSDESLQVIRQVQRMGEFLQRLGVTNFTIRDIN
ncbi:hypothetical protein ENBRE01_3204, partial [Enteropsectra breve]